MTPLRPPQQRGFPRIPSNYNGFDLLPNTLTIRRHFGYTEKILLFLHTERYRADGVVLTWPATARHRPSHAGLPIFEHGK